MGRVTQPVVQDGVLWVGEGETAVSPSIPLDSPHWNAWLASHKQFKFTGNAGHFSARRETRHRNDYWYAYRRRHGTLNKVYLGKSEELTLARLELAAASLSDPMIFARLTMPPQPQSAPPQQLWSGGPFPTLTKIRPPILPPNLITRPRLSQKISSPVTFICAPGGFGKSTLLNAWQQERHDLPVAWVTLDADDNRLLRFWSTVLLALQAISPGLGQELMSQFRLSLPITPAEIAAQLANEIACVTSGQFCLGLILDDYHHIQHPDIHASMQLWLERLPPGLQLVVASRTRPPLALGRLRAQGAVTELELEDLRFTMEEGIDFLQQHIADPPLAYRDMEALVKRTGGWAAGLTLAVLALNKQPDRRHFLDTFNGAHLYLREYFMETALTQQPTAVQTFLLQTSILKELTGDLCDAVTGQADAAGMLERLWQENLFVARSEEPGWYRYHDLFAEMLHDQLQLRLPDQVPDLHRRAAAWYRQQNVLAEAVRHLLAIEDWEEAASLIEDVGLRELAESGEDSRLLRWLQQLPETVVQRHKTLLFVYLRLAHLALPAREVDRFLESVETNLGRKLPASLTPDEREVLAEVRQIQRRIVAGDTAVSQIGASDPRWQLLDDLWIVEANYKPQTEEVGARLRQVFQQAQAQGNLFVVLIAGADCANRAFLRGQLRQSEKIVYQVLQQALAQRGKLPEPASCALVVLAQICLARHELAEARELLQKTTAVDPNPTASNMPINISIARAKLQAAQGNHEAALTTIQAARALHSQRPAGVWRDQDLAVYEALFHIPLGNWREVERLLNEVTEEDHRLAQLVRAEMLLRQGQAAAAEELCWHLLEQSLYGIANEPLLGARIILALALFQQRKMNQARQVLTETARWAAPERFIQPFLAYGSELAPLLALVLRVENLGAEAQAFIREILRLLGRLDNTAELPDEALKSLAVAASITERERDVLRLVRDGLSNIAIARELCIAPGTVKTHLANIYDKLEVRNRIQAVAEAQALGLI